MGLPVVGSRIDCGPKDDRRARDGTHAGSSGSSDRRTGMANQKRRDISERLSEGPDDGGPGQAHREQVFGMDAERQSRDDLRDDRGGATDSVSNPRPRQGDVPSARTPHADTDPRRPPADAVDAQPEGLKRARRDPLSPSRGRASEPRASGISTHAEDPRAAEPDE
jgi:hypothetical protein